MQFLSKLLCTNVKTGLPSYSLTAFMIGVVVINLKLLFSGIQITSTMKLQEFSGIDYGAALAALGALHVGNKAVRNSKSGDKDGN